MDSRKDRAMISSLYAAFSFGANAGMLLHGADAAAEFLGYSAWELDGTSFAAVILPEDREKLSAKLGCGTDIAELITLKRKDGSAVTVYLRGTEAVSQQDEPEICCIMTEAGALAETVVKLREEAEKCRLKLSEAEDIVNSLTICAEKDPLTQVLNSSTTRRLAEEYLWDGDKNCALMIIDIDNFKQINDRYGHMAGDCVLVNAAKAIRKLFRTKDIVGRIGGDEFLVLMKDVSDKDIIATRCAQILESFKEISCEPIPANSISCSVGGAIYSKQNNSYNLLFAAADKAMYKAKALGKASFRLDE